MTGTARMVFGRFMSNRSSKERVEEGQRFDPWPAFACAILLVCPFVILMKDQGYSYHAPEFLFCLGVLGIVGGLIGLLAGKSRRLASAAIGGLVIVVSADFQFDKTWASPLSGLYLIFVGAFLLAWFGRNKFWKILTAAAATILISTFAVPGGPQGYAFTRATGSGAAPRSLPIVVHLILDEHIGLEGIPSEIPGGKSVKQALKAFYREHDFLVFGRAYSQYMYSIDSIGHLLNLAVRPDDTLVTYVSGKRPRSEFDWQVNRSRYFQHLAELGFRIHVRQTSYLDLCGPQRRHVVSCRTYPVGSIRMLRDVSAPLIEKVRVVASTFVVRSYFYRTLRAAYNRLRDGRAGRELGLPAWRWERARAWPLSVMTVFKELNADIRKASPGDAFLAHLLLPHDPYIYDSRCRLKVPKNWLGRWEFDRHARMTVQGRVARHESYFKQIGCLYRKLGEIMDSAKASGFADRFVFIFHGDHGSRLGMRLPGYKTRSALSERDLLDGFSTLFAVRLPKGRPGYEMSARSIQELLSSLVAADFRSMPAVDQSLRSPVVTLTSRPDGLFPIARCALPEIDAGRRVGPMARRERRGQFLRSGNRGSRPKTSVLCKTVSAPTRGAPGGLHPPAFR